MSVSVDSGPGLSRRLADHVTGLRFDDVPDEVVERAKERLVHHLGLAFQALDTTDAPLSVAVARELSRAGGDTTIIGQRAKASALDAVFANSRLMGHRGMDDGVVPGGAHPSTIVLPTALAVAQHQRSSGREFLCAVLAGYDVMCKLARISYAWQAPSPRRPNMIFAPLGAAAAAARLMRLSEADAGHAIAHAADSSTGLLEASSFPYWAHPRLARSGLLAATMAQAGIPMSPTMLEGPHGLYQSFFGRLPDDVEQVMDELGHDFEITKTLIKRWPASGLNVLALQYAHDVVEKHAVTPDDIASVTIVLPAERREREAVWERAYEQGRVRQSAVRFLVAAVLTDGSLDVDRYDSPPAPDLAAVLDKTQLAYEADRPVLYTRLEIALRDGRQVSLDGDTWDHRHLAKPRAEWRGWLLESARGVLRDDQVDRLEERIGDIEQLDDVNDLIACLVPDSDRAGGVADSETIAAEPNQPGADTDGLLDATGFYHAIFETLETHESGTSVHVDIDRLDQVDEPTARSALDAARTVLTGWATREGWAAAQVRPTEFGLFAPDVQTDSALRRVEPLRHELDAAMAKATPAGSRVTASMGISTAPRDGSRWARYRRQLIATAATQPYTVRSELARLQDRQQIIELHDRLAAILDANDSPALASLFTDDAVMEGLHGGQWRDAETIAHELGAISTHHLASHRMMTNHRIVLAGDRARAVVSFRSSHEDQVDDADTGSPHSHAHEGWYLSDLARTPAGWRFAWMRRANLSDFLKPGAEGAAATDEVYRAHLDPPWN